MLDTIGYAMNLLTEWVAPGKQATLDGEFLGDIFDIPDDLYDQNDPNKDVLDHIAKAGMTVAQSVQVIFEFEKEWGLGTARTLNDSSLCRVADSTYNGDTGEAYMVFEVASQPSGEAEYYKTEGWYCSYGGADFSAASLTRVYPKPVTVYQWVTSPNAV